MTVPLLSLFLSGSGALLLQQVWTRAGVLVFGSTTVSVTVVISVFMAGLALGYGAAGRFVARLRNPLLGYALAELSAAVAAFGVSRFLDSGPVAWNSPAALIVGLLLAPTFLMGLTVPLVVAGLEGGEPASGSRSLAWAYGINTLGGAAGAFLGAFWVMPAVGISASGWIGSALLASAGLLTGAVALRRAVREPAGAKSPEGTGIPIRNSVYLLAFLGGAAGLSLEIVWTRILSLVFGPSVYALGIVLAVNLIGIGLGSLLAPVVIRRWELRGALAGSFLAGGCAIALGAALVGVLPYLFLGLVEHLRPSVEMLGGIEVLLSSLALLPVTMVQGLLIPLLVSRDAGGNAAANAGKILSVNTAGSILGACGTGLVLIPRFGFLPSLLLFFGLYLAAGLTLFGWRRNVAVTAVCLLSAAVFSWRIRQSWDRSVLASGVYKYAVGAALAGGKGTKIEIGELLYYREGVSSTVAVIRTGNDRVLSIDGKADATAYGDRSTQILLGALPLSLSERGEETLVIGFASGVTAGISSRFPGNRVTAVEIEPAVFEASAHFLDVNHGPLRPPEHRMVVGDARHYLLRSGLSFDVITSEPSNPWMSGVAPLFTREFFELSRSRLRPGGVMCQWLPIYGMSRELVASVLGTFAEVFPHVLVFESIEGYDLLMIGSLDPRPLDPGRMERRWGDPALRAELRGIGIGSGLDLLARFTMAERGVRSFAEGAPANTDGNGFLEFRAPKALHRKTAAENNRALSDRSSGFEGYLDRSRLSAAQVRDLGRLVRERGEWRLAEELR